MPERLLQDHCGLVGGAIHRLREHGQAHLVHKPAATAAAARPRDMITAAARTSPESLALPKAIPQPTSLTALSRASTAQRRVMGDMPELRILSLVQRRRSSPTTAAAIWHTGRAAHLGLARRGLTPLPNEHSVQHARAQQQARHHWRPQTRPSALSGWCVCCHESSQKVGLPLRAGRAPA